jgi:hypothetical protein
MNEEQLLRSIQTIGMGCFVKYFEAFCDTSIKDEDLIDALMKIEKYEESGARARVSQSRRINRGNLTKEALAIISESTRTEPWVVTKANSLLNEIT